MYYMRREERRNESRVNEKSSSRAAKLEVISLPMTIARIFFALASEISLV